MANTFCRRIGLGIVIKYSLVSIMFLIRLVKGPIEAVSRFKTLILRCGIAIDFAFDPKACRLVSRRHEALCRTGLFARLHRHLFERVRVRHGLPVLVLEAVVFVAASAIECVKGVEGLFACGRVDELVAGQVQIGSTIIL